VPGATPRYSKEFKSEAVQLVRSSARSTSQTCSRRPLRGSGSSYRVALCPHHRSVALGLRVFGQGEPIGVAREVVKRLPGLVPDVPWIACPHGGASRPEPG
jgi:hypothetical protein